MCYGKMLRIAGQWPSDGKQISERLKENMVQNRFKVVSNAVPYFWVSLEPFCRLLSNCSAINSTVTMVLVCRAL